MSASLQVTHTERSRAPSQAWLAAPPLCGWPRPGHKRQKRQRAAADAKAKTGRRATGRAEGKGERGRARREKKRVATAVPLALCSLALVSDCTRKGRSEEPKRRSAYIAECSLCVDQHGERGKRRRKKSGKTAEEFTCSAVSSSPSLSLPSLFSFILSLLPIPTPLASSLSLCRRQCKEKGSARAGRPDGALSVPLRHNPPPQKKGTQEKSRFRRAVCMSVRQRGGQGGARLTFSERASEAKAAGERGEREGKVKGMRRLTVGRLRPTRPLRPPLRPARARFTADRPAEQRALRRAGGCAPLPRDAAGRDGAGRACGGQGERGSHVAPFFQPSSLLLAHSPQLHAPPLQSGAMRAPHVARRPLPPGAAKKAARPPPCGISWNLVGI